MSDHPDQPSPSTSTAESARRWAALWFGVRRQWLLLVVVLLIVTTIARLASSSKGFPAVWTWLDPALTLGTLGSALLLWFGEALQDWQQQLPQQLTVEFHYQDKTVFLCERAPLIDEAPRAWAQQICRQMNGNQDIKFWPIPETPPPKIERWEGGWVRHRTLRFELQQPRSGPSVVWNHANGFGRKSTQFEKSASTPTASD